MYAQGMHPLTGGGRLAHPVKRMGGGLHRAVCTEVMFMGVCAGAVCLGDVSV